MPVPDPDAPPVILTGDIGAVARDDVSGVLCASGIRFALCPQGPVQIMLEDRAGRVFAIAQVDARAALFAASRLTACAGASLRAAMPNPDARR